MRHDIKELIERLEEKIRSGRDEKTGKIEQEKVLAATQGDREARHFCINMIYTALQSLKLSEKAADGYIKSYHINYFENTFCDNPEGPVEQALSLLFEKYSVGPDGSFEHKLQKLAEIAYQEIYGYSVVDPLVHDNAFDEVGCNRYDYIWVQHKGIKRRVPKLRFADEATYKKIIEDRLVSTSMQEMNTGNPLIYCMLKNGCRVTALCPPLSRHHAVGIRVFNFNRLDAEKQERFLKGKLRRLLEILVKKGRRNIAVIGEQGSGKTTLADIITSMTDENASIGLAENIHELNLSEKYPEKNIIEIQYSERFSPSDALVIFFRLNRDIVILGEVRDPAEAFEVIKAMLRQARGSIMTFHTSSVERLVHDMPQLLMQSGHYKDYRVAQFDVADAVDIVIQIKLDRNTGERFIYRVAEITAMSDTMSYRIKNLFRYDKDKKRYIVNKTGLSNEMLSSCLEYELDSSDIDNIRKIFEIEDGEGEEYEYD